MSELEVRIDGEVVRPAEGCHLDLPDGPGRPGWLRSAESALPVLVEGEGSELVVTFRGRRIPVSVRTWRERVLAEAERAAGAHHGPVEVRATLPGLVVAVAVAVGDEVAEAESLLTIEAMKMQNEVRAPRAGRVIEVAIEPGRAVATGTTLVRLE